MTLCFIIMWLNFVRIQNGNIGKYGRTIINPFLGSFYYGFRCKYFLQKLFYAFVKQITWIANFLPNSLQFSKIMMKFDKINQIWNFCGCYKPHNSYLFIDVSCKCFVFKILISKKGKQPYFYISIEKIIFRRFDDKYSLKQWNMSSTWFFLGQVWNL